jgi:hypothetical protein
LPEGQRWHPEQFQTYGRDEDRMWSTGLAPRNQSGESA